MLAFWIYSIVGQTSGDFFEPGKTSEHPWYLVKSCSVAWEANRAWCCIAKISFFLSVSQTILYSVRIIVDIFQLDHSIARKFEDEEGHGTTISLVKDSDTEALSPVLAYFPA